MINVDPSLLDSFLRRIAADGIAEDPANDPPPQATKPMIVVSRYILTYLSKKYKDEHGTWQITYGKDMKYSATALEQATWNAGDNFQWSTLYSFFTVGGKKGMLEIALSSDGTPAGNALVVGDTGLDEKTLRDTDAYPFDSESAPIKYKELHHPSFFVDISDVNGGSKPIPSSGQILANPHALGESDDLDTFGRKFDNFRVRNTHTGRLTDLTGKEDTVSEKIIEEIKRSKPEQEEGNASAEKSAPVFQPQGEMADRFSKRAETTMTSEQAGIMSKVHKNLAKVDEPNRNKHLDTAKVYDSAANDLKRVETSHSASVDPSSVAAVILLASTSEY